MGILSEVLLSLVGKAIVFLPITYAIRFLIEKVFGFTATFKSTYLGLVVGNVVASTLIPVMFLSGILTPHGNDPSKIVNQMVLHYAVHFTLQTISLSSLCRDTEGKRLSVLHAALVALALTLLSAGITVFFRATAV